MKINNKRRPRVQVYFVCVRSQDERGKKKSVGIYLYIIIILYRYIPKYTYKHITLYAVQPPDPLGGGRGGIPRSCDHARPRPIGIAVSSPRVSRAESMVHRSRGHLSRDRYLSQDRSAANGPYTLARRQCALLYTICLYAQIGATTAENTSSFFIFKNISFSSACKLFSLRVFSRSQKIFFKFSIPQVTYENVSKTLLNGSALRHWRHSTQKSVGVQP